jgi:hypothetical protein
MLRRIEFSFALFASIKTNLTSSSEATSPLSLSSHTYFPLRYTPQPQQRQPTQRFHSLSNVNVTNYSFMAQQQQQQRQQQQQPSHTNYTHILFNQLTFIPLRDVANYKRLNLRPLSRERLHINCHTQPRLSKYRAWRRQSESKRMTFSEISDERQTNHGDSLIFMRHMSRPDRR